MSCTVLILRPGSEPNDTWAQELEGNGYEVLYAEDVSQAHVHARISHIDFVVIDSPQTENKEVTHFVSGLAERNEAPPLVLVSSSPSAPSYSVKLGAAAFLPKPCLSGELTHVLKKMSSASQKV